MSSYRDWQGREDADFSSLKGKTLTEICINEDKTEIKFTTNDGERFVMHHFQDCCEDVFIEDINGSLDSLIGSPILMAESVSSSLVEDGLPEGYDAPNYEDHWGSYTWTFYKLGNTKDTVTIRWYGESNGYYSEEVSFSRVEAKS